MRMRAQYHGKRIYFEPQILEESILFFVEVLVSHKPTFSDNSF